MSRKDTNKRQRRLRYFSFVLLFFCSIDSFADFRITRLIKSFILFILSISQTLSGSDVNKCSLPLALSQCQVSVFVGVHFVRNSDPTDEEINQRA